LVKIHNVLKSPVPKFDLDEEFNVQERVKEIIKRGVAASAHDVSEGGLITAIMECSFNSGLGFNITTDSLIRKDAFLFGESQSRVVISVSQENEDDFIDLMIKKDVDFHLLGHVTTGDIVIDDESWGNTNEFQNLYEKSLGGTLKK
jgi:phosphoribosylformylglycinamidine synthase